MMGTVLRVLVYWGSILVAIAVMVLFIVTYAQAAEGCEVEGEQGFVMYDGSCMTPSRYDATFSAEALAKVESQVFPGQSVAEVYGLTPEADELVAPSDRVLGVGLTEPFTFRSWLAQVI